MSEPTREGGGGGGAKKEAQRGLFAMCLSVCVLTYLSDLLPQSVSFSQPSKQNLLLIPCQTIFERLMRSTSTANNTFSNIQIIHHTTKLKLFSQRKNRKLVQKDFRTVLYLVTSCVNQKRFYVFIAHAVIILRRSKLLPLFRIICFK